MAVAIGIETAEPIFDHDRVSHKPGLLVHPAVKAQPGENHRLVRPFAESLANTEEKHGDKQK